MNSCTSSDDKFATQGAGGGHDPDDAPASSSAQTLDRKSQQTADGARGAGAARQANCHTRCVSGGAWAEVRERVHSATGSCGSAGSEACNQAAAIGGMGIPWRFRSKCPLSIDRQIPDSHWQSLPEQEWSSQQAAIPLAKSSRANWQCTVIGSHRAASNNAIHRTSTGTGRTLGANKRHARGIVPVGGAGTRVFSGFREPFPPRAVRAPASIRRLKPARTTLLLGRWRARRGGSRGHRRGRWHRARRRRRAG